jgi:histidine triad (HIT) family protein
MENCLFCKFVSGEFKTEIVFENEDFIIIKDIAPKAKNHFLAIPKKHFKYLAETTVEDSQLVGRMLKTIPTLEEKLELGSGYRLVINQGDDAGQTVPHLHIHILSGQKMEWNPA